MVCAIGEKSGELAKPTDWTEIDFPLAFVILGPTNVVPWFDQQRQGPFIPYVRPRPRTRHLTKPAQQPETMLASESSGVEGRVFENRVDLERAAPIVEAFKAGGQVGDGWDSR
jgi:hypothetical protein